MLAIRAVFLNAYILPYLSLTMPQKMLPNKRPSG